MTRLTLGSCFSVFLSVFSYIASAQNYSIAESSRLATEGVRQYNDGNLDGAAATFRKAIVLWPKNTLAQFNLGLTLADKGDLSAAAAAYEQAIALMEEPPAPNAVTVRSRVPNPVLAEALNNLALVYYQQNRIDDALARTKDCVGRFPEHPDCLLTNGVLLQAQNKLDEAIVFYRKAFAVSPKLPAASQDLGNALVRKGSFDEAVQVLQQGVRSNPRDADLQLSLGGALSAKEQFPEAQAALETSLKLRPDNAPALMHWARYIEEKESSQTHSQYCKKRMLSLPMTETRAWLWRICWWRWTALTTRLRTWPA